MNNVTTDKAQQLHVEEAAAKWLLLLEESPTKENTEALKCWLDQDERHKNIYHDMKLAWSEAALLTESDLLQPHERIEALTDKTPIIQRLYSRFSWPVAFASCVLLIVAFTFIELSPVLQKGELTQKVTTVNKPEYYTTPIGESRIVRLSDDSTIAIASGSAISVNYTETKRSIELLKGEALFTVSKNKIKPFVVTYKGRIAQALGTAFNVKESQGDMHVQVLEGTVKVASIANSNLSKKILTAGQGISVNQNGSMSDVSRHTNSTQMGWQKGRLSYVNVALSSVVYDISRYVPLHIYIQDKSVADMRFTGNIKLERIEEWFADLPDIFPLDIQQYGDTKVMTKRE
ncbi:FecR family protein [Thalassotalea sediminis]|uniref:FecR family protein n=1 Tax=Thalassotalea sediminis TaxID=1759089 RepID=UPI0025729D3D|nr:FecR domain-containing protein [Thalassotalea sediminis]